MRLVSPFIAGMTDVAYGTVDTTQKWPIGTRAFGVQQDFSSTANVLNAGGGEFIYGKSAAATPCGTPVTLNSNTGVFTAVANTANLGSPIGFAANRFTAADQFGWVQVSGNTPVVNDGTYTANVAIFIQAAGVLSATVAAGKQILGARSVIAAAATFTRVCQTKLGSTVIQVLNKDTSGIFAGLTPSGTGIAASTVTDIDPGGAFVTLSAAATATGQVTVTFTYTGLGSAFINHPFAQGQIT